MGGRVASHRQQTREFDERRHRDLGGVDQHQPGAVFRNGHPFRQDGSRPVREQTDQVVAGRPPLPPRRGE